MVDSALKIFISRVKIDKATGNIESRVNIRPLYIKEHC